METQTPENGKKARRGSLAGRLIALLSVLTSTAIIKTRDESEPDMQYGTTTVTQVMVASPCRLVR